MDAPQFPSTFNKNHRIRFQNYTLNLQISSHPLHNHSDFFLGETSKIIKMLPISQLELETSEFYWSLHHQRTL